jgi:hypothetical protein
MKKLFLFLLALFLIDSANATVLLVNNATLGPGQYAQIDAALAAANAGDTIYVSSSATAYANCTIDKSIVLVGPGSFADKQNNVPASISLININSNISGIVIQGFTITSGIKPVNKTNINNLQISYNYFTGTDAINCYGLSNSSNIKISCNIFDVSSGVIMYFSNTSGVSNVLIENNIIRGSISTLNASNTIIQNNVFYNHTGTSGSGAFYNFNGPNVTNAQIINNIFYNSHPSNYTSGCVFQNNITYSSSTSYPLLDTVEHNINNVNPLFVNVPITGGFSISHNFHLQNGSPAIGTGLGGTDMGFYGGGNAVTFKGEVIGLPVVRQMYIQNTNVPQNGNVNVKVRSTKARTN